MPSRPPQTGAELIARTLHALQIRVIFGLVGIPVIEIAEACLTLNIKFIGFRNEQACSYAATAYGYLTGTPGVCLVVGGPGVLHGMAGIGNASINAWPLLMLAGSSETRFVGKGGFQELDAISMLTRHTKTALRPPSLDSLPTTIESGFRTSFYGRPGPTFIDLPADLIQGTVPTDSDSPSLPHPPASAPQALPSHSALQESASLIRSAKAPLVVIGKGAAYARAETSIRALIAQTKIPFLPTPMGKGVAPDSHPLNVASARSAALKGADVVLLLGARLNWILHFGQPPKWNKGVRFIQVDVDAAELSRNNLSLNLLGDLRLIVPALCGLLGNYTYSTTNSPSYLNALLASKEKNLATAYQKAAPPKTAKSLMTTVYALTMINETLASLSPPSNGGIIFVSEGANTMDTARSIFSLERPRQRLDAGTHATMGIGMGYAIAAWEVYNGIGADAGNSRKKVVCIEGDSAFGFSGMEIETMARYKMDVLLFVINNGGVYHGDADTSDDWQELQCKTTSNDQPRGLRSTSLSYATHYEALATACGGTGFFVETPQELEKATRQGFGCSNVCVVNVMVESGKGDELRFAWQQSGGSKADNRKDAKL